MNVPIWQNIRDQLTAEIADGQAGPGVKLPTEAELATRFGVNRHTVRRALAAMRDAGLVHSRRGAGVFVTSQPVAYPLRSRTRFRQSLADQGHTGSGRTLRLEPILADRSTAEALGVALRSPVLVMEGIGEIDGQPATHSEAVFPMERVPGLDAVLRETTSVTAALKAIGIADYRRAWTRIRAERAPSLIARHLRLPEGAPVIVTRSLNVDPDGLPLELGRTHFCADRVELLVEN